LQVAARTRGLDLRVLHASSERDFESVFANLVQLKVGGLVIGPDPLFGTRLEQLAALAIRHAVPAIYMDRQFSAAGGLMSYGASIEVLNLKTAKALGLDIPLKLHAFADEVIE
jgi:putative ABC transport system substrate-binding protein